MGNRLPLQALALMASVGSSILLPAATWAGTIGANEPVGFGPTVVSSYCDLSTGAGSLGVARNRNLITSDVGESGPFSGSLSPGTISAASNLSNTGALVVDAPTLTGGTAATTSQVRLGAGTWATSGMVNLGSDGSLSATNVHVKFQTTNNNNKFDNGTYLASATVTCTDNGTK